MTGSREQSPDWLRNFQAPCQITLSSGSESPLDNSHVSDDEDSINLTKLFQKDKTSLSQVKGSQDGQSNSPVKTAKVECTSTRKRKKENRSEKEGKSTDKVFTKRRTSDKPSTVKEPSHSVWTLSSDSEPSPDSGSIKADEVVDEELLMHETKSTKEEKLDVASTRKSPRKKLKEKDTVKKRKLESQLIEGKHSEPSSVKREELDEELIMHDVTPTKEEKDDIASTQESLNEKLKLTKEEKGDVASTQESRNEKLKGEDMKKKKKLESQLKEEKEDIDVLEENNPDKQNGSNLSSSRLPLVFPEKVQRTKALVECDGDNIDLSGDMGSVGRIVVSDGPSGNHEMLFDLKGTIYKTTILPSRTFCVVSFGQSEAKVEAIMNDFIQLKPHSNVYEAETMVEGTLDGFTFDSDEEAENLSRPASQADQNENVDHQTTGNAKTKAKKTSAMEQKKGKKGGTISKKVTKKPQVQKNNSKKKPQVQKKSKSKK